MCFIIIFYLTTGDSMKKVSSKSLLKKSLVLRITYLIIILGIFLSSSFLIPNSNNITEIDRDSSDLSQTPLLADSYSILFVVIYTCGNPTRFAPTPKPAPDRADTAMLGT